MMRPERRRLRDRPHADERGTTSVELAVVAFLIAFVLVMFQRGVVSMGSVAKDNRQVISSQSKRRDALDTVRRELHESSMLRITVAPDNRSVRYEKLIGADVTGGEVSGAWSGTVELAVDARGNLVKTEDGSTFLIASRLDEMRFERPPGASFIQVTATTTESGESVTRTIRVTPRN